MRGESSEGSYWASGGLGLIRIATTRPTASRKPIPNEMPICAQPRLEPRARRSSPLPTIGVARGRRGELVGAEERDSRRAPLVRPGRAFERVAVPLDERPTLGAEAAVARSLARKNATPAGCRFAPAPCVRTRRGRASTIESLGAAAAVASSLAWKYATATTGSDAASDLSVGQSHAATPHARVLSPRSPRRVRASPFTGRPPRLSSNRPVRSLWRRESSTTSKLKRRR